MKEIGIEPLSFVIEKSFGEVSPTGVVKSSINVYEYVRKEMGLPKEDVAKVKDFENNFVAANTLAIGRVAVEAMKRNEDLSSVGYTTPLHKGESLHTEIERNGNQLEVEVSSTVSSTNRFKAEDSKPTLALSMTMTKTFN